MYKKILVPLDGSKLSECSLDELKTIALGCHVPEVVLLAVIEGEETGIPFIAGAASGMALPSDAAEIKSERQAFLKILDQAVAAAGEYLKRVSDILSKEGLSVTTKVLRGKPAESILDYANKNGIDLVIMSTHGHGAAPWDVGKVADRIIRYSNIPVVVASPPGCRV